LEIDTERENFLSLTATGRKILSQMDGGQEDTAIIQRRLEEMNQRWNHLKAKSIAIRLEFFFSSVLDRSSGIQSSQGKVKFLGL
jgi:DNA-binding MarR family transcriptional regulator